MSTRQQITPADVGNEILDFTAKLWRWLVLVAAIAVGTCLGMTLFVLLVLNRLEAAAPDIRVDSVGVAYHQPDVDVGSSGHMPVGGG